MKFDVVILAGGFGERLRPLTRVTHKSLLRIGGKSLLERLLTKVEALPNVNRIFVTHTNIHLEQFKKICTNVTEVIETENSDNKLGSVGALSNAINIFELSDNLLVLVADTIFDFKLENFISFVDTQKYSGLLLVEKSGDLSQYGLTTLDFNNFIIEFSEKASRRPISGLVFTGNLFLRAEDIHLINDYVESSSSADTIGHFLEWLLTKTDIKGFVAGGTWFDIGNFDELAKACEFFGD